MLKRFRLQFFLILLCWCSFLPLQAEGVVVQLDKPIYTAGDLLGYQLFFPQSFQQKDLALKVAIYHPDGYLVCEHFLQTEGAIAAEGYLKIPYDIPSTTYHWLLLGTTKDGLKRVKMGEIFIPIYDDLSNATPAHQVPTRSTTYTGSSQLKINFQWDTEERQRRERIKATLRVEDQQGRSVSGIMSVAVKDASLLALGTENESSTHYLALPDGISAQLSTEIHILGQILDSKGNAFQSSFLSAYVKAVKRFFYTQSDQDGRFSLQLPGIPGEQSLQFMDFKRDDIQVVISDEISLGTGPAQQPKPSLATYLNWSRLRKKIYKFYGTVENPVMPIPQPINSQAFAYDQRFPMRDYEPFDDLTIFFNEIVTPFKIRPKGKRGYVARMFNPAQQIRKFYPDSPVFIVDGYLTRDADFIYRIPIENIDTIDLFFYAKSLQPQFGPIAHSGMVIMKTSLVQLDLPKDNAKNIFQLSLLKEEFETTKIKSSEERGIHIGPNILWLTNQTVSPAGQYDLEFQHSDDLGSFLIEITVQSADGKVGTYAQYYEVTR